MTTGEVAAADILYTDAIDDLRTADSHIIGVPTPVDHANQPDLTPLVIASETVGRALKTGDIVVYESTVYPGDREHTFTKIKKVVSGQDAPTLAIEAAGTNQRHADHRARPDLQGGLPALASVIGSRVTRRGAARAVTSTTCGGRYP